MKPVFVDSVKPAKFENSIYVEVFKK